MGKRSSFERKPHDFYPTPMEAIAPLMGHLPNKVSFCEPCAGQGHLIRHLEQYGHRCASAFDADERQFYPVLDALHLQYHNLAGAQTIITNPPWSRDLLHPMIERFASLVPTWLLFDADWAYTKQSGPYMDYCHRIIAVGRVKWIEGSKMTGKDNCAWYMFDRNIPSTGTVFHGR